MPWQFGLPDAEHAVAWKFLMDEAHFKAPYGPTTTSRSDTLFQVFDTCCRWSGNSWPYATTQTLAALANVLRSNAEAPVNKEDYVELLRTYTRTQYKDGRPYIAESADPFTGSWFGSNMPNHSEHYLHSGYVDLVLSGLLGIVPRANGHLWIDPLIPDDWDWFAVEGLKIHGHEVDVIWDRDGSHYGKGEGLQVRADNQLLDSRADLGPLTVELLSTGQTMAFERPHNLAVNNGRAFPEITASFSDPAHPPFWAADGGIFYHKVPTTRWTTEGSPNAEDFIQVDFGGPQTVERVKLYFLDDGEGIVPPTSYRIDVLKDGEWSEAEVRSRIPGAPAGRRANQVIIGPTEVEGVRVTFEHAPAGRTGLAEIEVWTPAGADVREAVRPSTNLALNIDGAAFPRISSSFPENADMQVLQDGQFGLTTYQSNRWIARNSPNAQDWIQVDFDAPTTVKEAEVYLWGNAPRYRARTDSTITDPAALGVQALIQNEWQDVSGLSAFPDRPKAMARNILRFDPIETTAIRIVFTHPDGAGSGATELILR